MKEICEDRLACWECLQSSDFRKAFGITNCNKGLAVSDVGVVVKNTRKEFWQKHSEKDGLRGLGDVVAKVIHSTTGIQPCGGCKKRQEALNRLVPFRQLTPPT
jgi:hypothetical protein